MGSKMAQEIIADIIAEKRARADEIEGATGRDANQFQCELVADLRAEADRLEAAWKREKAKIEADALAAGGIVEAERHKPGNAAAMREALEAVIKVGYPHNFQREAYHIRTYCYEITEAIAKCRAALALPPRNCDVGTAEEQAEWFGKFCKMDYLSGDCSDDCPLYRKDYSTIHCPFTWAQMPYEEGGVE